MISRFFRPFLGGIFFDNDLKVTSRLFEFVMRMLALGRNSLPAEGIGAVSDQLAARLPKDSIICNFKVSYKLDTTLGVYGSLMVALSPCMAGIAGHWLHDGQNWTAGELHEVNKAMRRLAAVHISFDSTHAFAKCIWR